MKVTSPSILSLRGKRGLKLNQDTLAKILPTLLGLLKIKVVGLIFLNLLAPSVGGVIMVSAWPIRMVAWGMGRMVTR